MCLPLGRRLRFLGLLAARPLVVERVSESLALALKVLQLDPQARRARLEPLRLAALLLHDDAHLVDARAVRGVPRLRLLLEQLVALLELRALLEDELGLRGVRLLGVDQTMPWGIDGYPQDVERWRGWRRERLKIWEDLADTITPEALRAVSAGSIGIDDVYEYSQRILDGKVAGRLVIDIAAE